jgi:hypothetical protein
MADKIVSKLTWQLSKVLDALDQLDKKKYELDVALRKEIGQQLGKNQHDEEALLMLVASGNFYDHRLEKLGIDKAA